jgi:DNA polymerase-3 subunit gamma/tau
MLQDTTAKMQSGNRRSEMELVIIKLCSPELCGDIESLTARVAALERGTVKTEGIPVRKKEIPLPVQPVEEAEPVETKTSEETEPMIAEEFYDEAPPIEAEIPPEPITEQEEPSLAVQEGQGKLETSVWKSVLAELSKTAPLISGILSGSSAYVSGQFLLIDTENSQFASLINGKNNVYREKLRGAIETVLGRSYKLGPYRKKAEASEQDDPLLPFKERLKALEIPKSSN